MLDPKQLRSQPEQIAAQLRRRGFELDVEQLTRLETERKQLQGQTQQLQSERNSSARAIGQA